MRNKGIITILVGIGLLFISIFFSSVKEDPYDRYDPRLTFIGNIARIEIVLAEGKYVRGSYYGDSYYEGRVVIPLKYALSLSVLIILVGTGIILISKNKETSA